MRGTDKTNDRTNEQDALHHIVRLRQEVRALEVRLAHAEAAEREARRRVALLEESLRAAWRIPIYATRRPEEMKTG